MFVMQKCFYLFVSYIDIMNTIILTVIYLYLLMYLKFMKNTVDLCSENTGIQRGTFYIRIYSTVSKNFRELKQKINHNI